MNKPDWFLILLVVSILNVAGFAMFAVVVAENYEQAFTQRCIAAGGTTLSRYMTMIGKSGYQERLCIKPESVIEVAP